MSDDLKAQIEISADASGVEAGVGKAKKSLADLGNAAANSGRTAAVGFSKIGENAAGSATKVDAATRSQINSIQRLIAATEAGSKSSREYQEALARIRGTDINALRPYLDQLDAVNAKQKKAEESAGGFGRALGSLADYAKAAAAGLAAAFSVGAIISKVNEAIDTLAKLDDVSQKTGASIENLSRLQKVSSAFGQDFGNVDSALTKLAKGMATVDGETNKTNKALTALGVKSRDAAGALRDPSEVMVDVAKRLQGYRDDASKAALATDLFGKAGADLIPYLNDVAENVDKFGGASEIAAKRAAEFQDKLGIMRVKSDDLFTSIASDLLPTMIDFVDSLSDAKKESDGLTKDGQLTSWVDDLAVGLARVVDVARLLPALFKSIGGSFKVVGADINVLAKKAVTMNPFALGQSILRGENPFADLAAAKAERDKILKEANDAYNSLWNTPGNTMEQSMLGRIAGKNTRGENAIDALGKLMLGDGDKPSTGYTSGTAATAQLSEYQKLIQTINEKIAAEKLELQGTENLTEGRKLASKVMVAIRDNTISLTEKEKIRVTGLLEEYLVTEKSNEAKKKALKVQSELTAEIEKWNNATAFDHASLEEEIAMFGKSADARKIFVAQLKVDAEARERIDSIRKNGALPDEIALILFEAEARKKNIGAIQGEMQALAGADQLRQENKRFTANAIADEEDRAAALLSIDAELWQERIRLAGEGTEAQKLLQEQFDQWYANRQMAPVLDRWKNIITNLDNDFREGFRDMLTHGQDAWKSFSKSLGNTLKTALADALYQTFIKKYVVQIVAGIAGMVSGPAVANALTGGVGGIGQGMNLLSAGKTLWEGFNTGFANFGSSIAGTVQQGMNMFGFQHTARFSDAAFDAGLSSAQNGAVSPFAQGVGTAAGYLGNAALGYGLSKGLSGGYKVNGVNEIAAVASAFMGPIAGLVGAAVNRAFGSKVVGSGVLGSITGDQFSGNAYTFSKGGLFRGDKTKTSALDTEVNAVFADAIKGMYANFSALGDTIGVGGDLLKDFSYEFRLALADFDDAGKQKEIQRALSTMSDSMAQAFVDSFRTSIDTAQQQASRYFTNTSDGARSFAGGVVDQVAVSSPLDPYIADIIRIFDAQKATLAGVTGSEGKLAAFTSALFGLGDGLVENAGYLKLFGEALDFAKLEAAATGAETVVDTFGRLNTIFSATNSVAATLGKNIEAAFGQLGLASTAARERLITLAGGVESLASGTAFFAQNFLSPAEQMAPVMQSVQDTMASLGLASVDTKEEFRDLVKGLELGTEAGAQLYAKLIGIAPAFHQVATYLDELGDRRIGLEANILELEGNKSAAVAMRRKLELDAMDASLRPLQERVWALEDEAEATEILKNRAVAAVDSAFGGLQRSVGADRKQLSQDFEDAMKSLHTGLDGVNSRIGKLTGLSGALKSTIDRITVSGTADNERLAAKAQIETAIALARAGGVFPDTASLSRSLDVVSQINENNFASFVDFQREQLLTKNSLQELAGLTDDQLSVEEQTLKSIESQIDLAEKAHQDEMSRLDGILESAQMQIDALHGIDTSTKSVSDAIASLKSAIAGAAMSGVTGIGANSTVFGGSGYGSASGYGGASNGQGATESLSAVERLYADFSNMSYLTPEGGAYWASQFNAGKSLAEIEKAFQDSVRAVRGYATGGDHFGGWRIVGENGPELEATGPSRIFNASQTADILRGRSDNAAVVNALARVEKLLENISAETRAGAQHGGKTARLIERAMPDGDAVATRVEA